MPSGSLGFDGLVGTVAEAVRTEESIVDRVPAAAMVKDEDTPRAVAV
jgi:hypothetical protein